MSGDVHVRFYERPWGRFPRATHLTLADVHAALAYYFDHRAEIEERIAESGALIDVLRKENVSRLAEKLREQTRNQTWRESGSSRMSRSQGQWSWAFAEEAWMS